MACIPAHHAETADLPGIAAKRRIEIRIRIDSEMPVELARMMFGGMVAGLDVNGEVEVKEITDAESAPGVAIHEAGPFFPAMRRKRGETLAEWRIRLAKWRNT